MTRLDQLRLRRPAPQLQVPLVARPRFEPGQSALSPSHPVEAVESVFMSERHGIWQVSSSLPGLRAELLAASGKRR